MTINPKSIAIPEMTLLAVIFILITSFLSMIAFEFIIFFVESQKTDMWFSV